MDKYEYKVRSDEIKTLIAEGEYAQAADIADTIDWRRVKSVIMLCTVSDLYKINRRYEDAKNMLLLAYERRPGGRTICYSLCELCIKTEEFVQALKYYKEFVQAAPKDPSRFILQYKLYEAQEVSLEERIGVLEELKKRDYREKWAYELAFLYHRVGLATRCVEECDEMILWFGDGKYVIKAMELKMLHQPLSPAQQQIYDHRFDHDMPPEEEQAEYVGGYEDGSEQGEYGDLEDDAGQIVYEQPEETRDPEEMDIQVKTVDVGQYNTINLQAELAEGLQEVLGSEEVARSVVEPVPDEEETDQGPEQMEDTQEAAAYDQEQEEIEGTEVFFGETGEISQLPPKDMPVLKELDSAEELREFAEAVQEEPQAVTAEAATESDTAAENDNDTIAETAMEQMRQEELLTAQPPREMAEVLSQEANGQISLVIPEESALEKQLTGQMKIEDVLHEWERMKKANEEKCREEVRQHVLRQTGPMFTEFEASVRDGLLEQLENGVQAGGMNLADELSQGAESVFEEEENGLPSDLESMENVDGDTYEEPEPEEEDEVPADLEYIDEEPSAEAEYGEDEDWENEEYSDQEWTEYSESEDEIPEDVEYEEVEDGDPEDVEYIEWGDGDPEEAEYEEYAEEAEGREPEDEDPEEAEYVETAEGGESEYRETAQDREPEEAEYIATAEYEESEDTEYIEAEEDEEAEFREENGEVDAEELSEILEYANTEEQEEDLAEEEEKDRAGQKAKDKRGTKEKQPVQRDKARARGLTREEKELYAPFIQSRHSREQLVKAIDNISMAAYTGNVVVTGEEGMDTLTLAKNMIREVRMTDSNFSGKVAKISGQGLNGRNIGETLERLNNGALIIEDASGISAGTARKLYKTLQQERLGIIVVLEGTKKAVNKLFLESPELAGCFTARMDLEALSNNTLVSFGRLYAREMEYSIDDLGVLALHTRIEELQTIDHVVTVIEVKKIVDEAIRHASRKTLGHFFDILFAKRYDNEDMVILTEKDFVA